MPTRQLRMVALLVPLLMGAPILVPILAVATSGCGIPDDSRGTTREVLGSGTLRAGVSEAPPWLMRLPDGGATGVEADLIRAFARDLGVEVEWSWGPLEDHLRELESNRLHVVAGGLRASSPWRSRVSLTVPYAVEASRGGSPPGRTRRVLAVPPGENAWLTRLERFLLSRRTPPRDGADPTGRSGGP